MLTRLVFISLLLILCDTAYSQESSVSLDYVDAPLTEILQEIKRQADIKLAYDNQNLRVIRSSISIENTPVSQALDSLLKSTDYESLLLKSTWLIIPKESTAVSEGSEPKRNFSVSGRLVNGQTGEALPYANVSLRGVSGGTITNLNGYFNISEVRIDTIPLCFSYVGFRSRCIDLSKDATDNMLIKLSPSNTYLLAVDIIGEQVSDISVIAVEDIIKLDARSLKRNSSTASDDLFQSIQMLPGVSSSDVLDAQLHIRGGEEDENLVLWDGFTLYHLDHFFGVFSTLNPTVIQDINLRKGPFESRFGGRSGGVLEVTGRSGNRINSRSHLDMDLIDMGVMVEGPVGEKSSYLFSFRRSHSDFIRSGFYADLLDRLFAQSIATDSEALTSESVDSEYFYHDLNFKWQTELSEKDRLDISLFNGGDEFSRNTLLTYDDPVSPRSSIAAENDYSNWGNLGTGLQWSKNLNSSHHMYTSLGYSQYHSEYYYLDSDQDFLNDNPFPKIVRSEVEANLIKDVTLLHRHEIGLDNGSKVDLGYQFTYLEVSETFTDRSFSNNSASIKDSSTIAQQHAVFLDRYWQFTPDLRLRAGGRLSVNNYSNSLYLEPRLQLTYALSDRLTAHVATGNYIQQIRRVAEQNLFLRQADRWMLSDGDRLAESRSFHSALGLTWEKEGMTISAEGYYKVLKGVVLNQEQNRLLSEFTAESEGLVSGDGMVGGADLLLSYDQKAHSAWLAYSYTYSANEFKDIEMGSGIPSTYNKPHDLKLVYNYRLRDYMFHSQVTASSGYPYTPILGFFEGPGGDAFLAYGQELSARLPNQFRWDISLSRTFSHKNRDLTIGLGVFNLTDHTNVRARTYSFDQFSDAAPEELEIKVVDLELIGLSPTFSISLDFR